MFHVWKKITPFLIPFFSGSLYLYTLAPGLTWAYDGADGGDFLTAIATGGVPHPGGYPTYLLFTSLFTRLPLGSLAFRGNLFSAVCMILAVFIVFQLVISLTGSVYVSSLTALLFGTFPLIWSQALITEVYALQTLLSVLVLFFLISTHREHWFDVAAGLALGLAVGNHLTALFMFPLLFMFNYDQSESGLLSKLGINIKLFWCQFRVRLLGFFSGLSVYIILPLRASNQAPVNWGNAVDWDGFWWLASGAMYHNRLSHFSLDYLFAAIRLWSQFLIDQMSILGLLLAIFYIVLLFQPSRLHFITVWLVMIYSVFSIHYFSPDSYVYLMMPLFSFALWISLGCKYAIDKLRWKPKLLKPLLICITSGLVIARAIWLVPVMDISKDHTAEDYAQTVLETVPQNSILISQGDEATFSLWYFHYVDELRSDIAIISRALSSHPWYHEVLSTTYPEINLSEQLSIQSMETLNPGRPVCELSDDLIPQFICSELKK